MNFIKNRHEKMFPTSDSFFPWEVYVHKTDNNFIFIKDLLLML